MIGTSAALAPGRPRPKYPHPATLLFSAWRILVVCVATFFIHHFFTTTVVSPFIFNIVKSNLVQKFITGGIMKFLAEKTFIGSRLQANKQSIDDCLMYVVGTTVIHSIMYIIVNGFFFACDKYKWLQYYRIPVEKRAEPTPELIKATLKEALITSFFSGPITLLLLVLFPGKGWNNISSSVDDLNVWSAPFYSQIGTFVGALLFNEIFFYLVHRSVHEIPGVYKKVHWDHHRWVGSMSLAAEFASPIEGLLANFLPTSLFLAMMSTRGVPVSVWYTWLMVRLMETLEAHSGYVSLGTLPYHLGLLHNSCIHHYFHHTNNTGCYGAFWTDYLGRSMDHFLVDTRRLKAPVEIDVEKSWKGE